jgi:hypothetical protein
MLARIQFRYRDVPVIGSSYDDGVHVFMRDDFLMAARLQ